MKTYIGVKIIEAEPMNLGEYNKFRGWKIPENEDPSREGYLVKYPPDGYISWSPKDVFEAAYTEISKNTYETEFLLKNLLKGIVEGKNVITMRVYSEDEEAYFAMEKSRAEKARGQFKHSIFGMNT